MRICEWFWKANRPFCYKHIRFRTHLDEPCLMMRSAPLHLCHHFLRKDSLLKRETYRSGIWYKAVCHRAWSTGYIVLSGRTNIRLRNELHVQLITYYRGCLKKAEKELGRKKFDEICKFESILSSFVRCCMRENRQNLGLIFSLSRFSWNGCSRWLRNYSPPDY